MADDSSRSQSTRLRRRAECRPRNRPGCGPRKGGQPQVYPSRGGARTDLKVTRPVISSVLPKTKHSMYHRRRITKVQTYSTVCSSIVEYGTPITVIRVRNTGRGWIINDCRVSYFAANPSGHFFLLVFLLQVSSTAVVGGVSL